MRKEIMFAGSGGQGVITLSIIFGEAAALYENYHVVQCQSYGPEARGGSSNAHVIMDRDQPIGYPKAVQPHCMICLTQESLDKFSHQLRPGGLLLTDQSTAQRLRQLDALAYNLPMFQRVKEQIGLPIVFNICVLGAFVGLSGLLQPDSVKEVIARRVPARFLPQNLQAFDLGLELAATAKIWRAAVPDRSTACT